MLQLLIHESMDELKNELKIAIKVQQHTAIKLIDRITACLFEYHAYGAPGSPVDDGVPVMGVLIKD